MDPALIVAIVLIVVAVVVAAFLGSRAGRRRRKQRLLGAEAPGPRTATSTADSDHLDVEPADLGADVGGRSDALTGSGEAPTPPAGSPQVDADPAALTVELPVTGGEPENAMETTADIPRVGSEEFPLDGDGRPAATGADEPGQPAAHREPASGVVPAGVAPVSVDPAVVVPPGVVPEPRERHGGRHRAPAGTTPTLGRRGQPGRTGRTGGFRIPAARRPEETTPPGETTRPTQAAPVEAIRADGPREDIFRADATREQPPQAERPQLDTARAEAPRVEPVLMEYARVDPVRVDPARVDPARVDSAWDPARVEPPRMEPLPSGPARTGDPQAESPFVTAPSLGHQVDPREVGPRQVEPLPADASWPQPPGTDPGASTDDTSRMEPALAGTTQGGAPRWEFPVARFEAEMSRGAVARQTETVEADAPPVDDPAAGGGPRRDPEPVAAQPEQLYPTTGRSGSTPARGVPPVETDLFRANTEWSNGFAPAHPAPPAGWAPGGGDGSSAVDLERAGEPTTLIPAARGGGHDNPADHGEPVAAKGSRRTLADRLRGRNR